MHAITRSSTGSFSVSQNISINSKFSDCFSICDVFLSLHFGVLSRTFGNATIKHPRIWAQCDVNLGLWTCTKFKYLFVFHLLLFSLMSNSFSRALSLSHLVTELIKYIDWILFPLTSGCSQMLILSRARHTPRQIASKWWEYIFEKTKKNARAGLL